MNTAIQCIILLACTIICISAGPARCMCVNTISAMDPKRIVGVTQYGLRPWCNKEEVIVTLTNGAQRCLDPAQQFTIVLVRAFKNLAKRAAKTNTTGQGTTTSPGTSTATSTATTTTLVPTSS
ncbi:interleukin-8-like [Sparus aurata]|uniref:interleukin-8-like n=1 Tax=Sparus aurata TaxID=8175 RepID=UPI0011C14440|nr:interleukin-8-like [Sparus aurata]